MEQQPRPQIIKLLTELLDEAQKGNITSLVAVSFNAKGGAAIHGEVTEMRDVINAPRYLQMAHDRLLEMAQKYDGTRDNPT